MFLSWILCCLHSSSKWFICSHSTFIWWVSNRSLYIVIVCNNTIIWWQGYYAASYQLPLRKLDASVVEMSRVLLGSKPGSVWNRPRSLGYVPVPFMGRRVGLMEAIANFSKIQWALYIVKVKQFIYFWDTLASVLLNLHEVIGASLHSVIKIWYLYL